MTFPPRRPWYARWWYFWIAIAMGISLWWIFVFGGILLVEETTDTEVDRDEVIVENETTGTDSQSILLNETV